MQSLILILDAKPAFWCTKRWVWLPGRFMLKGCDRKNRKRLSFSKYQNQPKTKKRRKVIRGKKKQKDDTDKDKEGTVYKAGAFC